jgi:iron complex transport system ATP-binding protein
MNSTLALHNVGVAVADNWLIQDASLTLRPGLLTAILGPNGAGKTTLLKLLAGLWQPTVGKVTLNGRDLHQLSRRQLAQQIAFVPQNTHLGFAFTVQDLVMMGRHPHLRPFQSETNEDHHCVAEAMKQTDVIHLAQRLVTELSGGERQRVVIARSLATEAPIIVLDEPTASLDVVHVLELLDLLKKLVAHQEKTVVFATHDLNMVMCYVDQVVLIHQGRIFGCGSPEEVLTADDNMAEVFRVRIERVGSSKSGKTVLFFHRQEFIPS